MNYKDAPPEIPEYDIGKLFEGGNEILGQLDWYPPIPLEEKKIKMGEYPIDQPDSLKRDKNE